jgi:hypothetical protein
MTANRPRVLRGAFVEYGISLPPLAVVFQFNPVTLQRSRSLGFRPPNETLSMPGRDADGDTLRVERNQDLRDWHSRAGDLDEIREQQIVTVGEESLSFELRLDATDGLDAGDPLAERFGIAPALSTLELMTYPKEGGVLGEALGSLLGEAPGYQFHAPENPPLVLFVWGVQRVLPVNITGLTISETEFDIVLNPVRATVQVALSVIEGPSSVFRFTRAAKEAMAVVNSARAVTELEVPG